MPWPCRLQVGAGTLPRAGMPASRAQQREGGDGWVGERGAGMVAEHLPLRARPAQRLLDAAVVLIQAASVEGVAEVGANTSPSRARLPKGLSGWTGDFWEATATGYIGSIRKSAPNARYRPTPDIPADISSIRPIASHHPSIIPDRDGRNAHGRNSNCQLPRNSIFNLVSLALRCIVPFVPPSCPFGCMTTGHFPLPSVQLCNMTALSGP